MAEPLRTSNPDPIRLHHEAMVLADEADRARRSFRPHDARDLLLAAAEKELEAARLCGPEFSRAVLLQSAASLASEAGHGALAEQVIIAMG